MEHILYVNSSETLKYHIILIDGVVRLGFVRNTSLKVNKQLPSSL